MFLFNCGKVAFIPVEGCMERKVIGIDGRACLHSTTRTPSDPRQQLEYFLIM